MPTREDDILGEAIAGTEKELFDGAMAVEAEADDDDRSLEAMDDEAGTAEASEDEGENEKAEGDKPDAKSDRDDKGRFKEGEKDGKQDDGRVPRVALHEERTKRQAAEAERDQAKTELTSLNSKLDQMLGRLDAFERRPAPQAAQPKAEETQEPDIFTDPEGWKQWNDQRNSARLNDLQTSFNARLVEGSLAAAADTHGGKFETAYKSLTSLNPQDPAARAVVQRIWNSPNPGSALMRWHQEQETLREVGTDATAYREKVKAEAAEALKADPEFRKQLLADLQAEARGNGVRPRTEVRIPKSLNGASGRGGNADSGALDGSERGIFESVWPG
jgi:hypothetical protein